MGKEVMMSTKEVQRYALIPATAHRDVVPGDYVIGYFSCQTTRRAPRGFFPAVALTAAQ